MPYIGKSPSAGVRQRYQYTATAGQTTFSGTDLGNLTLTYTDNNFVDVFQNGVLLKGGGTDYTATSGTSVVLATGASVSDVIEIIVYDVFSVGNFYNRTDSDSRFVRHDSATAGTDNFIAGNNAGDAITSGGNQNTLVGNEAGTSITTGDDNTAVGYGAADALTTGIRNTAVGTNALGVEVAGNYATAIGEGALASQTNGSSTDVYNTAVGYQSGVSVTTGKFNTLLGGLAGDALNTGNSNVALGYKALTADTKGDNSIAIGDQALAAQNFTSSSDSYNIAIGSSAGLNVTTGTNNTIVGSNAADALTTSTYNVAIGSEALSTETAGSRHVAVGYRSLKDANHSGGGNYYNSALGYESGSAVTIGGYNTLLGAFAGSAIQSGGSNVCVGYNANTAHDTSNGICIGVNITATDNDFSFGKASNVVTNDFDSDANWSRSSDVRLKKNITDQKLGLDFINDLRTVKYNWKPSTELDEKDAGLNHLRVDKDSNPVDHEDFDGTVVNNMNTTATMHNFIAQEVKAALDKAGVSDFGGWKQDQYGVQQVSREMFVIPLVKAVQELSAKNDALEARIKKLEDG